LSKDKYQIPRKADFICLTILLDDLKRFDEDLRKSAKDIGSLIYKLRNTRNVFVSLHNLNDAMKRIRVDGDESFVSKSRSLRRDLGLIAHIRNKGVGHLDRNLLERAAQWMPQIFTQESHDDDEHITFECYRAVMESTINSYLNEDGEQKVFETEIDFLYPPNAEQFFEFLSGIIEKSIQWLVSARNIVKSDIDFHSIDQANELGAVAGKTNFDLNEESNFSFSKEEMKDSLIDVAEKMREMGVEEKVIELLEGLIK